MIADNFDISQDTILDIYRRNIQLVNDLVTDNPVIEALRLVLYRIGGSFDGITTELFQMMQTTGVTGLPKAANALSARLSRLESELSGIGISICKFQLKIVTKSRITNNSN